MLINLHIKNLALIDELDIDLGKGLNILTGETGAGKSIIIGSIGICLGGKFSRELLRDPEKDGLVELTFDVNDMNIVKSDNKDDVPNSSISEFISTADEGILTISRKLSKDRVVNRINGETVTVSRIKEVAEALINLHAQHEQTTLLHEEKHIEILDSSSREIQALKQDVREAYQAYMANRKELAGMNMDASERAKRVDFLRFEEEEIEAAKLISGEDTELEALYTKMNNAKEICEITESVYSSTGYDSSNSAGNQISRSLQKLKSIERYDKDAEPLITTLTDIEAILNEFNQSLSEYIEGSNFEEKTYVETEQRLNLINTLKSKYGRSIEDIQNSLEAIKTELDSLSDYEARLEELTAKEKELQKALEERCAVLSEARKVKAAELSAKITEALKSLNFSDVQFYMDMKRLPECTAEGFDSIIFMISTNVGEEPKPLHMVASGGELSRIMLATKSVLADVWDTPTLIFDEVDTGISGITAQKVAEMMKELSRTHQIISITHLPQIASKADNSFLIEKTVTDGRTFTGIRAIEGEDKVMELARLLGGDSITESVITAAREMLA